MKSWLQDNKIEMYSTHNKRKSVVTERYIRTLKNKIFKYMTSMSKIFCFDKLDDIVNKYNNIHHSKSKMKTADVKSNTYTDFSKENNKKDSKFKAGDHVGISRYKNIFAKGYIPNWSDETFLIKKVKNVVLWRYLTNDLNSEKTLRTFYEKELQK